MSKILKWYYEHIKFKVGFRVVQQSRLTYQWKTDPMLVYVDVNKSERYWNGEERAIIETVTTHLAGQGYCAIVRD
jgi:hypothetical protein